MNLNRPTIVWTRCALPNKRESEKKRGEYSTTTMSLRGLQTTPPATTNPMAAILQANASQLIGVRSYVYRINIDMSGQDESRDLPANTAMTFHSQLRAASKQRHHDDAKRAITASYCSFDAFE